jgi:hypothetical protein
MQFSLVKYCLSSAFFRFLIILMPQLICIPHVNNIVYERGNNEAVYSTCINFSFYCM